MNNRKKKVAVVCERHQNWIDFRPALAVITRNNSRMVMECENSIYHGIVREEQARGLEFNSMLVLGNPSGELLKMVNGKVR